MLSPLLMLFVAIGRRREPFRDLPVLFLMLFVACLAFRWLRLPPSDVAHMTHMRIDSLFAGVTLGYLYHCRHVWFRKLTGHYALVLAFLLCLPAAFLDQYDRTMQTVGITGLFEMPYLALREKHFPFPPGAAISVDRADPVVP